MAAAIVESQLAELRAAEQVHETFTALTVAGARSDQSNITLDGVDINDAQSNSVAPQTNPILGTPQGGVCSPLLANVYLHYALDEWFYDEVLPRLKKRASLIRFCDGTPVQA